MNLGKIKVKRCIKCEENYDPFFEGSCDNGDCNGDLKFEEVTIKSFFKFPNGNVVVCDENGRQIPHLQGALSNKDIEWKL